MAVGIQKNDTDITPTGHKEYYRPCLPKNGTLHKLAKINNNNSQIPRPTIDVIYIYKNCRRTYRVSLTGSAPFWENEYVEVTCCLKVLNNGFKKRSHQ